MYPDPDINLNVETDDAVYFFTGAFYPLDNYSAHAIEIWGKLFPTTEHAYQWKKFSEHAPEIAEEIISAKSPEAVKTISDANKDKMPESWMNDRVGIMEELLSAKVVQHEDVRKMLQNTGNKRIVENSPVDYFWGCGADNSGQNEVGKAWMRVRDKLVAGEL